MTNKTNLDELTGAEYQIRWEIQNKKERIVDAAKWLRENLDDLIKSLSTDGRITNSLGVLQGNGPALDRMIGEYATLLELQKKIFPQKDAQS
jgi:hypothetical protein